MLSKRVCILARDRTAAKRITAGVMAAGGAPELVTSATEIAGRPDTELFVVALAGPDDPDLKILPTIPDDARIILIIPSSDLPWITKLMADRRVANVLVGDPLDVVPLTATVNKVLHGDLFGLEKVLPWGVRVYSLVVGDYQEKANAIQTISDYAEAIGVRRKYREAIEQCIDEMMMNALYDAPVDDQGKSIFANVPIKERLLMRVEEKAIVQYACDGERFAVSVRDAFGTLERRTILQFLEKCIQSHGAEQIDRKASGAGLGLFLIANGSSQVSFHLYNKAATEVVCVFDLSAARIQLRNLGLFEERLGHAQPTSGPIKTVPRRRHQDLAASDGGGGAPVAASLPRSVTVALGLATTLLLGAVLLVAMPQLRGRSSAALVIQTEPPGATVWVDGRSQGAANGPLRVSGLESGRTYAVRATAPGRRDEERLVTLGSSEEQVKLSLGQSAGQVVIESDSPGATVLLDGKPTGKVTPATLELPSGSTAEVTLKKPGFAEARVTVTGGAPGERTVYRAQLPLSTEVAGLTIEITPSAASPSVTVDGLALMPPGHTHEAFVKPGMTHALTVSAPGYVTQVEEVRVTGGQRRRVKVALEEGGALSLKSSLKLKVSVDGKLVGQTPIEAFTLKPGSHSVALRNTRPLVAQDLTVTIEKGRTVEKSFEFGTVAVTASGVVAKPAGLSRGSTELALPPGKQQLVLVKGSEEKSREVEVVAGQTVEIDTF